LNWDVSVQLKTVAAGSPLCWTGGLGIEPIEAVIAVAFALAKAIVWDGVIISLESLTMGRSLFVTQEKFRHS